MIIHEESDDHEESDESEPVDGGEDFGAIHNGENMIAWMDRMNGH